VQLELWSARGAGSRRREGAVHGGEVVAQPGGAGVGVAVVVAYLQHDGRAAQVLAAVLTAARHDPDLRAAARDALGAPYSGLFERVLSRAVERGLTRPGADVSSLAEVFPAIAYQRVAAQGLRLLDDDVVRIVDGVLLPALAATNPPT
jgi:hypothetical protein